ncbi:MAG: HD-GYP domain-containing protein [Gallionellaceae bacterium]|nr:HD-GYP domain-containing protein [Gallionellaceae bacterium]
MADQDTQAQNIRKIAVGQLRPGMYIHDINCGWMDHPFVANHFPVKDLATIRKINDLGIHEVYIDIGRGHNVEVDAPTQAEVRQQINARLADIAVESTMPMRTPLAEESRRASRLHSEANRIVRDMIRDIRLGRQIELEQVEPLVEGMIDSIFRNPDALLPLGRLKEHDSYTFQHSVSVCTLMIAFARGLGLERATIKEIAIGALLHDVGKAQVPDGILNKPAKLTDAEFAKMKSHVVQSIIILQHTPGISQIALDVAGQHHERFDGTGYPNKLKGGEISLYGQMGAIVDVYDAITSDRVYHKGMPPTEALGKLLEWSKYHFDPELVKKYIKSIGIYPTGSLVRLNSGRLAIVLEQNPVKPMQPTIWAMYNAKGGGYLKPETVDLSHPACQDHIVSHEDFSDWNIDPAKWLQY